MLVTDADGTLMGQRPEFDQYRAFRSRLEGARKAHGMLWTVCTGRSLGGYKSIFRPMRIFGIRPDYVIVNHAYIFESRKWGYLPHWIWNARILWLQWRDEFILQRALPRIRTAVLAHNPFVRVKVSNRQKLAFRFDDESAAEFGMEVLRQQIKPYKYLQLFGSAGDVCVRVIPFTKGVAVMELARHLGIANSRILVVGDGHNDISMMELDPPCHTACPANAAPEVVATVHRSHGHIASERNLNGVLEILNAYERGELNNDLPADWVESEPDFGSRSRHHGIRGVMGTGILLFVVLYTTLLVVASFIRFPGCGMILKPYAVVVEQLERAWRYLDR